MITPDVLRKAGFIEDESINPPNGKSIWRNLTSKTGVRLIPNGDGAYIPYLKDTLMSDDLSSMIPCKQISTPEELSQLMNWIENDNSSL